MIKFLKAIYVIQEVSNKNRKPVLGRGFSTAYRLSVFNPLSYVVIIISLIMALLMFGFVGMWNEIDLRNPFKWN